MHLLPWYNMFHIPTTQYHATPPPEVGNLWLLECFSLLGCYYYRYAACKCLECVLCEAARADTCMTSLLRLILTGAVSYISHSCHLPGPMLTRILQAKYGEIVTRECKQKETQIRSDKEEIKRIARDHVLCQADHELTLY